MYFDIFSKNQLLLAKQRKINRCSYVAKIVLSNFLYFLEAVYNYTCTTIIGTQFIDYLSDLRILEKEIKFIKLLK